MSEEDRELWLKLACRDGDHWQPKTVTVIDDESVEASRSCTIGILSCKPSSPAQQTHPNRNNSRARGTGDRDLGRKTVDVNGALGLSTSGVFRG